MPPCLECEQQRCGRRSCTVCVLFISIMVRKEDTKGTRTAVNGKWRHPQSSGYRQLCHKRFSCPLRIKVAHNRRGGPGKSTERSLSCTIIINNKSLHEEATYCSTSSSPHEDFKKLFWPSFVWFKLNLGLYLSSSCVGFKLSFGHSVSNQAID